MNKYRIKETMLKIPLAYNIIKANLSNREIKSIDQNYGRDKRQYYRIFNCRRESPIIFFVHGGSWWHGSPKRYSYIGKFFNSRGYTVILTSYRLVPKFTYPTQINDIFEGFKHFLRNESINGDKNRIYVVGFSAGGELAANLVFNKNFHNKYNINSIIFKKFVSISGVLDFEKCNRSYAKMIIKNYLNKNSLSECNPINLIEGNEKIPVLCIHGKEDSLINPECSISFISKINNTKIAKLILLNNTYHSNILNLLRKDGTKESKLILEFLK